MALYTCWWNSLLLLVCHSKLGSSVAAVAHSTRVKELLKCCLSHAEPCSMDDSEWDSTSAWPERRAVRGHWLTSQACAHERQLCTNTTQHTSAVHTAAAAAAAACKTARHPLQHFKTSSAHVCSQMISVQMMIQAHQPWLRTLIKQISGVYI